MKVITRFAPSPTGYLHIGGLRTALFSYLWAKKNRGAFRLRIEDTDQKREVEGATKHLIHLLHRLGLKPDGDILVQSQRSAAGIYRKQAHELVARGHAYHCYCTPERLEKLRIQHERRKQPSRYDGTCRSLAPDSIREHEQKGTPYVIRLKIPDTTELIEAKDGIHGTVRFDAATLTDAILLKSDGFPTYHLASVVDDHEQHVTHVIRGEEWLPSLPLHTLLYDYFKYQTPQFYHLPLILNPDRSKLSKRQGHVSVEWYLEQGYLKEALINYVAFLGWNPGDDREIFSLAELIKNFELEQINKAGAVFSKDKLDWYNAWYVKNTLAPKPPKELARTLEPFLPEHTDERRIGVFNLFFERIRNLRELAELSGFLRELPDYEPSLLIFKKSTTEKTSSGLAAAERYFHAEAEPWTAITLELGLKKITEEHGLSFGDVFWPVRVALSGLAASPSPTDLAAYLGKKETVVRIGRAVKMLERAE
ncbi:MAG: glutamate--tRNA ligase [Candidatus Komeilibacteria bacterium]|nr:glutamate--tRNA ligase [Candidatus Komeilibacteria bacterium]